MRLSGFSLLLWSAIFASAQTPPPSKPIAVAPRIGVLGTAKITLGEVIERVLAADRDLVVSRINREEAVFNLRGALGAFDPRAGATAHSSRAITPVSSSLGGAANGKITAKELYVDPQLSGVSPYLGSSYKLDFASARQTNDSSFNTLNPQFPSSITLNLTQPLWRGLFFDENRHRVAVSRKNILLTDEQYRQRVIEVVTQAIQAYRELEFAYRNFEVQGDAVRLAEQQEASNRRQVAQGLLAPVDVVQTQTQVATFEQAQFAAQSALTAAENALKILMLPDRSDLMWGMALAPESAPESQPELPALDEAMKMALTARPELKQNEISLEVNKLDAKLTHDQTKPQIDAYATVSSSGLAGHPVVQSGPNPFTAAFGPLVNQINQLSAQAGIPPLIPISFGSGGVPPVFIGGYGQSLANLTAGHFTTAVVGVNISVPIRNRSASAAEAVSLAEGRRLKALRQQLEMAVEQDVRNALQMSASTRARLEAATNARTSAEEQYQSEQRQFQAGATTVFLVLQRQSDLIAARTREVRAQADAGEAQANLDRALARTLETRSIQLR